jgi:hypothetical protein
MTHKEFGRTLRIVETFARTVEDVLISPGPCWDCMAKGDGSDSQH